MEQDDTKVLYNAECPVCRFEIDHYRNYSGRKDLPVRFEDLNATDMSRWGLTRDEAARKLYVTKDGHQYCGISAFIVLWKEMPRYRWLARVVGLPVAKQISEVVYNHILAPLIYRWHLRRQSRKETVL